MTVLYAAAQVGLVLYMFLVGLEFDLDVVRGRLKSAAAVSAAGILVPMALGAALRLAPLRGHGPVPARRAPVARHGLRRGGALDHRVPRAGADDLRGGADRDAARDADAGRGGLRRRARLVPAGARARRVRRKPRGRALGRPGGPRALPARTGAAACVAARGRGPLGHARRPRPLGPARHADAALPDRLDRRRDRHPLRLRRVRAGPVDAARGLPRAHPSPAGAADVEPAGAPVLRLFGPAHPRGRDRLVDARGAGAAHPAGRVRGEGAGLLRGGARVR